MKIIRNLLLFTIGLLIAGCAQGAAPLITPTPVLVTLPTARVHLETLVLPTPTSSPTATITPTLTLTATLTLMPSITSSPTAAALFDKAQVTSVTTPGSEVKVSIHVPGLKTAYNVLLESRKFTCQTAEKVADVLFCSGTEMIPIAKQISLIFIDPQSGAEVYSGMTFIINQAVPTATPAGYGNCPNRGKNTSCEVECRLYQGNPCLVVSCFDDCGLYYSLDNCPSGEQNEGVCSEDLYREMKDKYGIP